MPTRCKCIGNKFGTNTDFEGNMQLKLPSQILICYIGMKTQSMAASSSTVNITMIGMHLNLKEL
jgi:hypothetical protein